jgi:hypothetical protein
MCFRVPPGGWSTAVVGIRFEFRYDQIVRFLCWATVMITKQQIHAEIERVNEESLDELYRLIRSFIASKAAQRRPGILSKLRGIQIEAPTDFAANLDLHLSGEKRVEENLH